MLFEDRDQDMNYFGERLTEGFVTEEEFLNAEYYDADMFETEDDLSLKMTDVIADVCQNEPKKTVNLRSSPKQVVQNPKKKVVVPAKQQSDPVSEKKQIPEILFKKVKETLTIRTNLEDNLLLVSYIENEEIMIFSEKGERLRIKGYLHLLRTMLLMKKRLMKKCYLKTQIRV